jgi:hypothetical protein
LRIRGKQPESQLVPNAFCQSTVLGIITAPAQQLSGQCQWPLLAASRHFTAGKIIKNELHFDWLLALMYPMLIKFPERASGIE